MGLDLEKLTRNELKAHLAARKLPTDGAKKDLVDRLKVRGEACCCCCRHNLLERMWDMLRQKIIDQDKEKEQAYLEELDEERRMAADLEERCVNQGLLCSLHRGRADSSMAEGASTW
jgi:hypothetical protein